MIPIAGDAEQTTQRIADVAAALRARLTPLVVALAGTPPRPIRLTQGVGLDKSLASRLVQATRAASDLDFLHTVPSPTGLRILLGHARGRIDAGLLAEVEVTVRHFEELLDTLPGGRQTLDAHMGEASSAIRERREQMARQASFKAVSFLFGHCCETLTTALFVLPSASPGKIDILEVHRRIGLQRLSAGMALPLLSVSAGGPADDDAPRMVPLEDDDTSTVPGDYLVAAACSLPLPDLQLVREGTLTTFVLEPGGAVPLPACVTTAYRVLHADSVAQAQAWNIVRNYMLHTPCRTLVRDIFLCDGLWPDAWPQIGFYLPGPSGTPLVTVEPGQPHLRRVNLTARIEQLPPGAPGYELEGVPDQRSAIVQALTAAGIAPGAFRGWRCRMAYPVPLIEMQLALRFAGPSRRNEEQ